MDLWIRSQHRDSLVKVNNLHISAENQISSIIAYKENNTVCIALGQYETEERAMEILNEIQNTALTINTKDVSKSEELVDLQTKVTVYEMPEK